MYIISATEHGLLGVGGGDGCLRRASAIVALASDKTQYFFVADWKL